MKARNDLDYVGQNSEKHCIWKAAEGCSSQIFVGERKVMGIRTDSRD
jgi:hypothetical protein